MAYKIYNSEATHDDRKTFQKMTSALPLGTIGSVTFLVAAMQYQGNPDRKRYF